jgi:hypothetical protein
MEPPALNGEND